MPRLCSLNSWTFLSRDGGGGGIFVCLAIWHSYLGNYLCYKMHSTTEYRHCQVLTQCPQCKCTAVLQSFTLPRVLLTACTKRYICVHTLSTLAGDWCLCVMSWLNQFQFLVLDANSQLLIWTIPKLTSITTTHFPLRISMQMYYTVCSAAQSENVYF